MTIDRLGENRVLIILNNKDMNDFSINFDTLSLNDTHSRKILMRIMQVACFKSGIEIKNRRVVLESVAFEETCYLLVTVERKQSHYRDKSTESKTSVCYKFGSSGNFLDAVEKLYQLKTCCNHNSAYQYNGEYYIIFDYPTIPRSLLRVLSEYGTRVTKRYFALLVKEHGKAICKVNAILQIGMYL